MIIGRLGVLVVTEVHLSQARHRVARETRLFCTIPLAFKVGIHLVTSRLAVPQVPFAGPRREDMSGVARSEAGCLRCVKARGRCCGQVYVPLRATWDDQHPPQRRALDASLSLTPTGVTAFLCSHRILGKGGLKRLAAGCPVSPDAQDARSHVSALSFDVQRAYAPVNTRFPRG